MSKDPIDELIKSSGEKEFGQDPQIVSGWMNLHTPTLKSKIKQMIVKARLDELEKVFLAMPMRAWVVPPQKGWSQDEIYAHNNFYDTLTEYIEKRKEQLKENQSE